MASGGAGKDKNTKPKKDDYSRPSKPKKDVIKELREKYGSYSKNETVKEPWVKEKPKPKKPDGGPGSKPSSSGGAAKPIPKKSDEKKPTRLREVSDKYPKTQPKQQQRRSKG